LRRRGSFRGSKDAKSVEFHSKIRGSRLERKETGDSVTFPSLYPGEVIERGQGSPTRHENRICDIRGARRNKDLGYETKTTATAEHETKFLRQAGSPDGANRQERANNIVAAERQIRPTEE
jgi:hypothetical protein